MDVRRLLTALALVASGCGHEPAPARHPDVLLITLDTVRADHCSAYGYARPTTPTLEQIAADGVRCEVAYAPMATTAPAHASMFTGLLPRSHGVLMNGHRLPEATTTLAEALRGAGYRTGAFVSSFVLERRFGLEQGFDRYDDDFHGATSSMPLQVWNGIPVPGEFDRRADETRAHALEWMKEGGWLAPRGADNRAGADVQSGADAQPSFAWIHFFDPHGPYAPEPEYAAQFPPADDSALARQIAAYDAEIRFVDDQVRQILDALAAAGRLDDTLVVVAADHGEGLMQHGHMHHGVHLYEEAVRVPLVFQWRAGLPRGTVLAAPVQLVDVAPTILALAGVSVRLGGNECVDLAPSLRGERKADPMRPVLLQRRRYESDRDEDVFVKGEKHGVRAGKWKLISAPAEGTLELYDLETDPWERVNVRGERAAEAEPLERLLEHWLESPAADSGSPAISPEDEKRLRSLGYVR